MIFNASGLEIFQLVVAAVGLGFAFWLLWLAIDDIVAATETPPNDVRRLLALGTARRQIARVAAHGVLLYIGIASILLPPPPFYDDPTLNGEVTQSTLVRLGLVVLTVILTTDSIMERKHRHSFLARIAIPKGHPQEVVVLAGGKTVAKGEITEVDS